MSAVIDLPGLIASIPQPRTPYATYPPERLDAFVNDERWATYRRVISSARAARIPFAIGGGLATAYYTGHWKESNDIDFYVLPRDCGRLIDVVSSLGLPDYYTEKPYDRAWIYRAHTDDAIVDVIWAMANGAGDVDWHWIEGGAKVMVRDLAVDLIAPEELLWSKVHVIQRDRCDWPDLLNLLYANGQNLDWRRLLKRMTGGEALLGSLLALFAWLAPGRAADVPEWVWKQVGHGVLPYTTGPALDSHRVRLIDSRPWFTGITPNRS